jgi:hypothetical protein
VNFPDAAGSTPQAHNLTALARVISRFGPTGAEINPKIHHNPEAENARSERTDVRAENINGFSRSRNGNLRPVIPPSGSLQKHTVQSVAVSTQPQL